MKRFVLLSLLLSAMLLGGCADSGKAAAVPTGKPVASLSTLASASDEAAPADTVQAPMLYAGDAPVSDVVPMIETYATDVAACYAAPRNGEVCRSLPLTEAMEQYGDGARYRVIVELFRDEQPLSADGDESAAERERLASLGYTVAYETLRGEDAQVRCYFTLHATCEQLSAYPASADYGCMLFLYGELEKSAAAPELPVVYNEPQRSTGSIPMDSVEICGLPPKP